MEKRTRKFDAALERRGLNFAVGKWIFYKYGKESMLSTGCGAEIIGTTVHHDAKFLVLRSKISGRNMSGRYPTLIEVPYRNLNKIVLITEEQMEVWKCHDRALKLSDLEAAGINTKFWRKKK